jgi:hypothetical protein
VCLRKSRICCTSFGVFAAAKWGAKVFATGSRHPCFGEELGGADFRRFLQESFAQVRFGAAKAGEVKGGVTHHPAEGDG